MIERKSALEQPEIHRSGNLGVKIAKLLVDDGKEIDCQWHRTSIPIDGDVKAQISAVNANLVELGYPALSAEDISLIQQAHALMVARYAPQ